MENSKCQSKHTITLFGWLCLRLDYFWSNLRTIAFHHSSIFEVIFLIIYTLEQVLLVFFTYIFVNSSQELVFSISLMAVFILSTFALHKMTMNSRMKTLEKQLADAINEKYAMQNRAKDTYERSQQVISKLFD